MAASSIQEKTKPFQAVFIALNAEAILWMQTRAE